MSVRTTCEACGQMKPTPCGRCGHEIPGHRPGHQMSHPARVSVLFCDACFTEWQQVREFDEFETTVRFEKGRGLGEASSP